MGRKHASPKELEDLWNAQDRKCALSGIEITDDNIALDHIIPLSKGGSSAIENCQLVDGRVNSMKGQLDQEEFRSLCNLVTQHNS